jgi:orotate phosphoribosyltransferase-like protein
MTYRLRWTTTMISRGIAMREAGLPWLQIATEMGCSENAARYSLSRNRKEQCRASQARIMAKRKAARLAARPKLFPYVGQYDPETGRQSW